MTDCYTYLYHYLIEVDGHEISVCIINPIFKWRYSFRAYLIRLSQVAPVTLARVCDAYGLSESGINLEEVSRVELFLAPDVSNGSN